MQIFAVELVGPTSCFTAHNHHIDVPWSEPTVGKNVQTIDGDVDRATWSFGLVYTWPASPQALSTIDCQHKQGRPLRKKKIGFVWTPADDWTELRLVCCGSHAQEVYCVWAARSKRLRPR